MPRIHGDVASESTVRARRVLSTTPTNTDLPVVQTITTILQRQDETLVDISEFEALQDQD